MALLLLPIIFAIMTLASCDYYYSSSLGHLVRYPKITKEDRFDGGRDSLEEKEEDEQVLCFSSLLL